LRVSDLHTLLACHIGVWCLYMGFPFHFDFDAQSSPLFSLYKNRKLHYANNEIIFLSLARTSRISQEKGILFGRV
jgi:hypothetical protein